MTCQVDCDVCVGRVKVFLRNNKLSPNVYLQVKIPACSNLKRMDTVPTGSGTGTRDK